jgi:hypothetical protein
LRFNDQRDRRNWKVPGTARSWLATVAHPKVDLEELHRRLIPLIIDLDREFGQADTPPPIDIEGLPRSILDPPRQELHDLGIIRVFSGPRDPSTSNGLVIVSLRPVGGFIGPSDVTDEVAQELSDLGNLAKLRAASSGESSELFVWLSDSCGSMALHSPILRGELGSSWPTEDVPLPAGVTGAWAATGPGAIDHLAHAVWHSVGGPWVVHQPPERTALRG